MPNEFSKLRTDITAYLIAAQRKARPVNPAALAQLFARKYWRMDLSLSFIEVEIETRAREMGVDTWPPRTAFSVALDSAQIALLADVLDLALAEVKKTHPEVPPNL